MTYLTGFLHAVCYYLAVGMAFGTWAIAGFFSQCKRGQVKQKDIPSAYQILSEFERERWEIPALILFCALVWPRVLYSLLFDKHFKE